MPKNFLQKDYLLKIINAANEGIYVTDRDRRIVIWNKKAEAITGYRSEDVIGKLCHDNFLGHVDQAGNNLCLGKCPLSDAIEGRCSFGPEIIYLRHKDGRTIPIEVSTSPLLDARGNSIGAIELFEDVTLRIRNEQRLFEKTGKLEAVMDNIREGIIFLDNSGSVNLYNSALSNMLGLNNDLQGRDISSLSADHPLRDAIFRVDRAYRGASCAGINRCADEGSCSVNSAGFSRCWVFRCKQKMCDQGLCIDCPAYREMKQFLEESKEIEIGRKTISVISSFIEFRDKNEIWEVLIFRDVTAEKRDAVKKLASGAAHELRQPLQVIVGAVSLLADELADREDSGKYLEALEESCYRLNDIVSKMGHITSYRTKNYSEGVEILDIEKSSKKTGRTRNLSFDSNGNSRLHSK